MSEMGSANGASVSASSGQSSSVTNSGSATATTSASVGSQSQTEGNSSWAGVSPGHSGAETQTQTQGGETAEQKAARMLGDQDMDALTEIKVNGKTERVTVREAIKRAQLASASHEKMQQAAKIAKQAQQMQQLLDLAESNPAEFFKMRGKNFDQLAEEALAKRFELAQMSPEQRELMETKQKLQQMQSERENAEKEFKSHQERVVSQQVQQKLDLEIGEAFSQSSLPKEPFYVAQIAAEMLRAEKLGQGLTAKEAADKVKSRWASSNRTILEGMDAKAIHEFLGPKVMKALSDYELKRVTEESASQFATGPTSRPVSTANGKGNQSKVMNEIEYRNWILGRA